MATQEHLVPAEVSSGDGSVQQFPSRAGDNGIPNDVIRRVVARLNIKDTSGSDNTVTIEERDIDNNTTLRDWDFEVGANNSLTFSEEEIGISARQTRVLRASGDGAFDAEIAFYDER